MHLRVHMSDAAEQQAHATATQQCHTIKSEKKEVKLHQKGTKLLETRGKHRKNQLLLWLCEVVYCAGTNKTINKQ